MSKHLLRRDLVDELPFCWMLEEQKTHPETSPSQCVAYLQHPAPGRQGSTVNRVKAETAINCDFRIFKLPKFQTRNTFETFRNSATSS